MISKKDGTGYNINSKSCGKCGNEMEMKFIYNFGDESMGVKCWYLKCMGCGVEDYTI